jgi:hypothetical protein
MSLLRPRGIKLFGEARLMAHVKERRRHKRHSDPGGAYVILKPSDNGAGRLINIGRGGLMFEYVTVEPAPTDATELEIFVTDSLFRLHEVPCQNVWDSLMLQNPTISLEKRRCGLKFGELTPHQMSQLEYFIKNYTAVAT